MHNEGFHMIGTTMHDCHIAQRDPIPVYGMRISTMPYPCPQAFQASRVRACDGDMADRMFAISPSGIHQAGYGKPGPQCRHIATRGCVMPTVITVQ
jgi:hypothetical protein